YEAEAEASSDPNATTITIGVKDILPELTAEDLERSVNGYPVAIPQSIKDIDFGYELKVIFDTFYHLVTIDPEIIKIIFDEVMKNQTKPDGESSVASSLASSQGESSDMFQQLISVVLKNKDQMEHWIDGKEVEGGSAEDICLLDSNLLTNAVPTFLNVMEASINDSLTSLGAELVDLSDLVTELNKEPTQEDKKTAIKAETMAIFDVIDPLLDSEEGYELISNIEKMPGLYFDDNDNFLGAKDGLLRALADSVRNLDHSKVFSKVLPAMMGGFLTGDTGPLASLFGDDLAIGNDPKDSSGNSILGAEFAKLINLLADCQDVIGFAVAMNANSSNMSALEKSFSHLCSLETPNHEKQLVKLLAGFAESKILNPEVEGKKNTNFYKLFKNIFEMLGLGSSDLNTTIESIICDDGFDADHEVSNFVNLIQYICDNGLLGSLSSISLETMSEIKFEDLFSKVDGSELLTAILGTMIDSAISSNDLFTYVNEGGETVALSFKNITDWTAEGRALDTMTKYAAEFGDLSNMDLESIDPEMMESMFD
ncbi:MAG: hypothetical protein IKZ68_02130, partial [Bacilli bacterium]|nr:hypothetical protein [Bacilli bacterium]